MATRLNRDTQVVTASLRRAVARSGLSQARFARALGTSAPRLSTYLSGTTRPSAEFWVRANRIADGLADAGRRKRMSAPSTADAIARRLAAGETDWAWRMLLQGRDQLRLAIAEADERLVDAWEAAPGGTGAAGWDLLLAALTRHEFDTAGIPAPGWTDVEPLTAPWMPDHPFLSPERVQQQTPTWLRELNVYVPQRDLVTA